MKLSSGDFVDIIAPSSPPKNKDWKKGLTILKSWGLKVRFSEKDLKPWIFHSNSNQMRYRFLKQSFENPLSKAVWCLRGGYGSQKLMEWFSKAPLQKKLFIGFSDATAIHLRLNQWGWPSLHGPCVSDLPEMSKKNQEHLRNLLFGETKELLFKNLKVFHPSKQKVLKAPLVGGNLTLLQNSIGCSWFPHLQSHFVFLEDIGEEDYRVDRALHHLFFSDALKGVKALIFGSFQSKKISRIHRVLESFLEFSKIPLITGLPCGHLKNQQALPLKTPCKLHFLGNNKASLKIKSPSYTV